jgi:arginase
VVNTGRRLAVAGAASSIGIRPYDGADLPRRLDRAPAVFRSLGLLERLGADDLGDVTSSDYVDFVRPPGGIRNVRQVGDYARGLADRVEEGIASGRFTVVVGGDCSIVLGNLLGARRGRHRIGLAYVDAHADFATADESVTGSAASMCLALAVGRFDSPLAHLAGAAPLVAGEDVALIGRRDPAESLYGEAALEPCGILDISGSAFASRPVGETAGSALERVARRGLDGFWIHVDADVLNPEIMPAVDSPEPGGPGLGELAALLAPLARHPKALGMQVTIYDPALDEDRICARRLVTLLENVLVNDSQEVHR